MMITYNNNTDLVCNNNTDLVCNNNADLVWANFEKTKSCGKIKSTINDKERKKKVVDCIVKEILRVKQENPAKKITGECREIFRFKVKLEEQPVSFQWECFFEDICYHAMGPAESLLTGGILKTETNESFLVSKEGAELIKSLLCRDGKDNPPLITFLNGNRFEWIRTTKQKALPISFFDDWKMQKKIYREKIYPLFLKHLVSLMPAQAKVLELCGGDGEFASCLFNRMGEKIDFYVLIDANKKSTDQAKKDLKDKIDQSKVQVVEGNISSTDYEAIFKDNQVDLILGIGALTEQVLPSREAALIAIRNAVSKLKEGGYVMLTGLTSSWLMSSDFEELGLEVLNYYNTACLPDEMLDKISLSSEFYVARKIKGQERPAPSWNFDPPKMKFLVQNARLVWPKQVPSSIGNTNL